MNRREYLAAMGTTALSASLPSRTIFSEPSSPADFLVPSTEIPDAFTRASIPADVPLFTRLDETDPLVNDAVAAVRGFWAGGDEENPEWVLTTAACIFEDEVPFGSTVSSTQDSFNSFVDEYDEETSGFWRFERQNEQHSRYLEWVADILIEELLLEGPETEGERHVFTETMRLHSRGPVVLWTNLFGPVNQSFQEWPYDRLLNDITEFQQDKLDAVSNETIDLRSLGDFA